MATHGSKCIRCGKQRILAKTWKESIKTYSNTSVVTHELFVCPDKDCQKHVEHSFETQRQATLDRQSALLEREQARLSSIAKSHPKSSSKS